MLARRLTLAALTILTLSITACDPDEDKPEPCTGPAPVANAGPDQLGNLLQTVTLTGSGGGDTVPQSFRWMFVALPAGSQATLSGDTLVNPTFVPDRYGSYVVSLVVSDGCQQSAADTVTIVVGVNGNRAPTANPGTARSVPRRALVTLDGTGSSDPDGHALTYQWSFTAPAGSAAVLSDATASKPTFTTDVEGAYVASLTVNDGRVSSAAVSVTITAINNRPVATTSTSTVATENAAQVNLQGAGSDADGDTLTYTWSFESRPTGSTATLTGANTLTPSFVPDVEGQYVLTLVASDGVATSLPARATVTAYRPIKPLAHGVVDAEYSKALNRIIMVGTSPNALYIYDPVAHTELTVALPSVPTAVSVGPDGRFAAVGHNANISYVNLTTAQLVRTWPVPCDVGDVVLAGNGFAYAFPRVDQWEEIHSLNLSTGAATKSTGSSIRAGTLARLHPDGTRMYGADNGLSPSDIERYTIPANGTAQVAWDSPYHGDYPMCGDLWFSEDGARIFTRCGRVFRTGATQAQDMLYGGALSGTSYIKHLSQSAASGRVAVVPGVSFNDMPDVAMQLRFYTSDFLEPLPTVMLPHFVRGGRGFKGYGRFVFFSAAGDKVFVLQQAEPNANMLNDYGVVSY